VGTGATVKDPPVEAAGPVDAKSTRPPRRRGHFSRRVLGALRQAGRLAKPRFSPQPDHGPQGAPWAPAARSHRGTAEAYVFGSATGTYQPTIQTAWETLKLLANGIEPKSRTEDTRWNQEQLRRIDLRWHDIRHEGACRLLADGVDIRIIQLMLGHASIQQTQRYLNVTDEELRKGLEVSWINQGRPLRAVSGS
jgi:integrase